ncbi:transposase, partial [Mycobacterium tuberculosis]|uniref:transposase n=1 Tax=Mycobacterium tuberculosis TaxID=1773 RepID=UPI00126015A1
MRSKIPDLQRALEGRFDDHHALMCRLHLAHLDQLDAMIGALDEQIEQLMHPFCARRELIASIPGIGVGASATVISEIGADPAAWFPSAEHLASWVRLCPGNHESAGKRHHGAQATSTCSRSWSSARGPPCAPMATCASTTAARSASSVASAVPLPTRRRSSPSPTS